MSVSGKDFGRVSAPEKHISEFTADDVRQALASGSLWSEELSMAAREVERLGNAEIQEAFDEVVTQLLSGEYGRKGGSGFGIRNSLGCAVKDLLSAKPDIGRFNRLIDDKAFQIADDKVLKSSLKALRAELKSHLAEQGIKPFDGYNPETSSLTLADGHRL